MPSSGATGPHSLAGDPQGTRFERTRRSGPGGSARRYDQTVPARRVPTVGGLATASFDPADFDRFRFTQCSISASGTVLLHYAVDHVHEFVERFEVPVPEGLQEADLDAVQPLVQLLHWVAGVSYFKTAAPLDVACETGSPGPATAAYLEALYSEGLGEFTVVNGLRALPRPKFPVRTGASRVPRRPNGPSRVLVPVGGGKDSIVALEIIRRSGLEFELFSVRDDAAMRRTAVVAGVDRLIAQRELPLAQLADLNRQGALNGHVPITAIIACVALLTAALHGFDTVALANERSASQGNLVYDGVEINHQWSKSLPAERLLRSAAGEATAVDIFSILRPASELSIARRFATLDRYHGAFTSCNTIFRLDPALRRASWCADCPKCRFVFLMLAPFMDPDALADVFGSAMLDDEDQFDGFALLTATGGHKPFECVGEEEESLAAIQLLASDVRWQNRSVVRRLVDEALSPRGTDPRRVERVCALSADHHVPQALIDDVIAILGP